MSSAHFTVSYLAQRTLRMVQIEPAEWILDEVLLVRGGGGPYRWEVRGIHKLGEPSPVLSGEDLKLL